MHGEGIEPTMDHFHRYPDLLGALVSTSSAWWIVLYANFRPLRLALWLVLL
jgi:hypothetical protein